MSIKRFRKIIIFGLLLVLSKLVYNFITLIGFKSNLLETIFNYSIFLFILIYIFEINRKDMKDKLENKKQNL